MSTTLYIGLAVGHTPPSDTIQKENNICKNKKPPVIMVFLELEFLINHNKQEALND